MCKKKFDCKHFLTVRQQLNCRNRKRKDTKESITLTNCIKMYFGGKDVIHCERMNNEREYSRGQLLKRTSTMAHNKSNKSKYYCCHPLNVAKLSIEENNITIIAIIIIIILSLILSLAYNLEMLQIIK
uniref:Uncharacterized protein n=1 Tax=Glossina pallidipes TaxID=7398 RepID=A0A1A9Z8S2_GLOPL